MSPNPEQSAAAVIATANQAGATVLQPIVVAPPTDKGWSRIRTWVTYTVLMSSLFANLTMYLSYQEYFASSDGPGERFHSGSRTSPDKVALIRISGTIMPPFTNRILKTIETVRDDVQVKGVLLVVDSPGGLVADSHQIYHKLKELSEKKRIFVSMRSMAASGGYYVSMGAGKEARIFAEPTTWTGSIGVIVPHYEVVGLAEKLGFKAAPLKTGEFKDSLSPFREMTERDKALWDDLIGQSFEQFLQVIADNRSNLTLPAVRAIATGQVYTARDAKQNGMIDEIGYEEDALAALQTAVGISNPRIVTYQFPVDIWTMLLGATKTPDPAAQWQSLLDASVPRAMYLCSWSGLLPPRTADSD